MEEVSLQLLRTLADQGNPAALRQLGRMIIEGRVEQPPDLKFSPDMYILLAAMGHDRKASWLLCKYYLYGIGGFEADIDGAFACMKRTERWLSSDAQLSYADATLEREAVMLYRAWQRWLYRHWSEERVLEKGLTIDQRTVLEKYRLKIDEALIDLSDSLETGFMSDSKEAVAALEYEYCGKWPGIPGAVQLKLKQMAEQAWKSVSGAGGSNPQIRATNAMAHVKNIDDYISQLLSAPSETQSN